MRYIYSGNQKIAMIRPQDPTNPNSPEQVFYFINNSQGTPTIIQDNNQQPVAKINLNEWGVPGFVLGQQEEINFTGKKLDRSTGLYYFNQRYYDPEIGRFLSEDPAGQTSNPYLFCGNNPMMYVDPNGELFGIDDFIIFCAVVGGVAGGWGKDLTKSQTWGDIAMGVAIGAAIGYGGVEMAKAGFQFNAQAAVTTGGQQIPIANWNLTTGAWSGVGVAAAAGVGAMIGNGGGGEWQDGELAKKYPVPRTEWIKPLKYFNNADGEVDPLWPTDYRRITRGFSNNMRHPVTGKMQEHTAIDIYNPKGGLVYSVLDGIVSGAGYSEYAGDYIRINHGSGIETSYSHTASFVVPGESVYRGQPIGYSNGSGRITGPHLHFVLRKNGVRANPLNGFFK